MIREPVPEPERVRAYLRSHGWTGEANPPPDVEMFTFSEPSNDGHPITVFVPGSSDEFGYPLCVDAVVTTVTWIEDRFKEAVWDDLMGSKGNDSSQRRVEKVCQIVSDPDRIRAYLRSHGWKGEDNPSPDVEVFTFSGLADSGEPITVFVPGSSDIRTYPLGVDNIVTTVAAIEQRSKEAVWADLRGEKFGGQFQDVSAMIRGRVPEPEWISTYLENHGWVGEKTLPSDGALFTFPELSDKCHDITVFVPGSSDVLAYPLRVDDVIVTLASIERRPKEAILADILAGRIELRPGETTRPATDAQSVEKTLGVGKP